MRVFTTVLLGAALWSAAHLTAQNQPSTNRPANRDQRDPKMDAFYKLGPDSMPDENIPTG
jgi:hypothetical protein